MSGEAGGADAPHASPPPPASRRRRVVAVGVAILVVAALSVAIGASSSPIGGPRTSSTHISGTADEIVAAAAGLNPAGFAPSSSKRTGTAESDWAILQNPDGSEANITVTVYPDANASAARFNRLRAGVQGLPGYSDVSVVLSPFGQFGGCYAYGEDVDGIGVINGACMKGNAVLQVHLVSGIAFSDIEVDLSAIMGALYESAV
jgi:hypothetical protein